MIRLSDCFSSRFHNIRVLKNLSRPGMIPPGTETARPRVKGVASGVGVLDNLPRRGADIAAGTYIDINHRSQLDITDDEQNQMG